MALPNAKIAQGVLDSQNGGGHGAEHGRGAAGQECESQQIRELRLRVVARPDRPVAELLARLGLELPNAPKKVQNVVEKTG